MQNNSKLNSGQRSKPEPGPENGLTLTHHANKRVRQRGLRDKDVELIMECGTTGSRGRVALLRRDVAREVEECKRCIQKLERLKDWVVICEDEVVITCYNAGGQKRQQMLGKRGVTARASAATNDGSRQYDVILARRSNEKRR